MRDLDTQEQSVLIHSEPPLGMLSASSMMLLCGGCMERLNVEPRRMGPMLEGPQETKEEQEERTPDSGMKDQER